LNLLARELVAIAFAANQIDDAHLPSAALLDVIEGSARLQELEGTG
jgi:hypothetical protein